jgi:hypothetical protein
MGGVQIRRVQCKGRGVKREEGARENRGFVKIEDFQWGKMADDM